MIAAIFITRLVLVNFSVPEWRFQNCRKQPATLDLGWYLAVNAGRLARTKEYVIARYRDLLESHLRRPLSHLLWERMVSVGVMSGALMLLWAKALSLEESGSPHAAEEWNWWVTRLRHFATA